MEQQKQGAEEPKQQTIKKRSTAEHQKNQLRCWMEGRGWAKAEAESIHRAGRARSKKQKARSGGAAGAAKSIKEPKHQKIKKRSTAECQENQMGCWAERKKICQGRSKKHPRSRQSRSKKQEARKGGTAGAAKSIKEAAGRSKGSKQQENRRIRRNNR